MGKLSRTERTGLCLLAVILAAILGVLAIRRQAPTADIAVTAAVTDTVQPFDSIHIVTPTEPATQKTKKKTKQHTRKATEPPRRHLDDTF